MDLPTIYQLTKEKKPDDFMGKIVYIYDLLEMDPVVPKTWVSIFGSAIKKWV